MINAPKLNHSFFASSILLFLGQITVILLSVATQIVLARFLMPENRGIFAIYIVYSSFFMLLVSFASEFGIRFLFIKGEISREECFALLTLVGLIGVALTPLVIVFVEFIWQIDFVSLVCALIFTILSFVNRQCNVVLTLDKQYAKASILGIVEELLKILALFFVLNQGSSVQNAFVALVVAELIVYVLYFYDFRTKLLIQKYSLCNKLLEVYGFGLRTFISSLTNLVNAQIGVIILSVVLTEYDVGLFVVAFGLAARTQVIPDILNRVVVSRSQTENGTNLSEVMGISSLILFSYLFLGGFVFLFAQYLLILMFGEDYLRVTNVFRIVLCAFLFKVLAKPLEAYFIEMEGYPMVVSRANLFGLVSISFGLYCGANTYGLTGAAIGICASLILTYYLILVKYLKATGLGLVQLYHPKNLKNLIG